MHESLKKGRARPGAPHKGVYESKQTDEAGAENAGANGQDSGRARAENCRSERGWRESKSDCKRRGRYHRDQDRQSSSQLFEKRILDAILNDLSPQLDRGDDDPLPFMFEEVQREDCGNGESG